MRLNQITLDVSDIKISRAFYLKLGFQLIVDAPHYCRFIAPEGETSFSIHVAENVRAGGTLYLESDDMDVAYRRLSSAGIVFDTTPTDESWLWREAAFRDPDGHEWKLYHAGENRLDPPWRVRQED